MDYGISPLMCLWFNSRDYGISPLMCLLFNSRDYGISPLMCLWFNSRDYGVKYRITIKVLFLYFNLCLSVILDGLSYSFTPYHFLLSVKKTKDFICVFPTKIGTMVFPH
jgi:hypothetical protein